MASKNDLFAPPSQEELDLFAPPSQQEMDTFAPPSPEELNTAEVPMQDVAEDFEPIDVDQEEGLFGKSWEQIAGDSPFKALPREKFEEIQRIAQEASDTDIAKNLAREGFTFGLKSEGEAAAEGVISEVDRFLGYPIAKMAGGKENIEARLKEDPTALTPKYDDKRLEDELLMKLQSEKSPRIALASEIGGSFLNPASWVGPAGLTKLTKASKLLKLMKAGKYVGLAQKLGPKRINQLNKAVQLAKIGGATGTAGGIYTAGKSLHKADTPEFAKEVATGAGITAAAGPIFGAAASSKAAAPIALTAAGGGLTLPLITGDPKDAIWGLAGGAGIAGFVKALPAGMRIFNKVLQKGRWNKLADLTKEGLSVTDPKVAKTFNDRITENSVEASQFLKDLKEAQYQTAAEDITNYFNQQFKQVQQNLQGQTKEVGKAFSDVHKGMYDDVVNTLQKATDEGRTINPEEFYQMYSDKLKSIEDKIHPNDRSAYNELVRTFDQNFSQSAPEKYILHIKQVLKNSGIEDPQYKGLNVPEEEMAGIIKEKPSVEDLQSRGYELIEEPQITGDIKRGFTTKETQLTEGQNLPPVDLKTTISKQITPEGGETKFFPDSTDIQRSPWPGEIERVITTPTEEAITRTTRAKLQKEIPGKPIEKMSPMDLLEARKNLNQVYRQKFIGGRNDELKVEPLLDETRREIYSGIDLLDEQAIGGPEAQQLSSLRKDYGTFKDVLSTLGVDRRKISQLEAGELINLNELANVIRKNHKYLEIGASGTGDEADALQKAIAYLVRANPEEGKKAVDLLIKLEGAFKKLDANIGKGMEPADSLSKFQALQDIVPSDQIPENIRRAAGTAEDINVLQNTIGGFDPKLSTSERLIPSRKAGQFVERTGTDNPEIEQALRIIEKYNPELAKKARTSYAYDSEISDLLREYSTKGRLGFQYKRDPESAAITQQGILGNLMRLTSPPNIAIGAGKIENILGRAGTGITQTGAKIKIPDSTILKNNIYRFPDEIQMTLERALTRGPSAVTATMYMLSQQSPEYREIMEEIMKEQEEKQLLGEDLFKE